MRCHRFVATETLVNATKIASGWPQAAAYTCTVALYADGSSGALLASATDACGVSGGNEIVAATGLTPFTVTKGTTYQLCVCASDSSASFVSVTGGTGAGELTDLLNEFSTIGGKSANSCTAGTILPPSTTGGLTLDNTVRIPVAIIGR
jgi:hypothetical protein